MVIDLDHNATTPIHPDVATAMLECSLAGYGNAASAHQRGRSARRILEQARNGIGRILGAHMVSIDSDRVILTSGGTEANNLALAGLAGRPPGQVLISSVEHSSVIGPAQQLERQGFDVRYLPVDASGIVAPEQLRQFMTTDCRLVSIMVANNETGVLQPIEQLAAICSQQDVPFHTDAVQAVGKIPVHFRQLQVTALTLSAHKFHGPRGIGALLLRPKTPIYPMLFGGFQQAGLRPGTEPIELAVGMHHALQIWQRDGHTRQKRMAALRDRFEESLRAANIGVIVNALGADRLPHTSNVAFPGLDCQALHMALDMAGVACSVGSACSSGAAQPSTVLVAMRLPEKIVSSSLRFSLGVFTTRQEIDDAVQRIVDVAARLHSKK